MNNKTVMVTALDDGAGGIDFEVDGVKAKQAVLKLDKGSGKHSIAFQLNDQTNRGLQFHPDDPIWVDEDCPCPEGESHADVRRRMLRAFETVNSERAVLVAHGTAIRIGATALLNLPLMSAMRFAQDNAAMNVFVARGDQWFLKVWNYT